jgi:hypothetical protein
LIPFSKRFPLFRALLYFFQLFLIIIIFTHVFCLSIFGSFSWERLFHSDSPHYFYCYFSVWLNMNWVSMSNFIVECEEHTSKHTAWHIDTHFWSANNFVCLLLSFSLSVSAKQFKYLDKDEFKDLKSLKRLHLDRNQLSVVVDDLFNRQKSLEFLGEIIIEFKFDSE